MTTYVGPTTMPCQQQCEVPEGVRIAWVPPTRRAFSDVVRCPTDDCGRTFLVLAVGNAPSACVSDPQSAEQGPVVPAVGVEDPNGSASAYPTFGGFA